MINSFMKRIQTEVKGIGKIYECRDILIREDVNTGICKAYSKQNGEKISDTEIKVFLANIENESDIISYKMLFLPGGRCKKINEQKNEFNLYTCSSLFCALLGQDVSPYTMIAKEKVDELISLYQNQKQFMEYIELRKVRIKGKNAYIGKYLEDGIVKQKELSENVISNTSLNDINNIVGLGILINNSHLQDFGSEKCNLKFTIRALQEIIERDRDKEIRK